MRIISGNRKGKTITPPRNFHARPTTDFAKENLFNLLNNLTDIEDCEVLDLFSGTGGISFEFASRGAKKIDSVEIENLHYAFIKKTAKELGFEQIHAIRNSAMKFIKFCTASYNIIFADPPYEMPDVDKIPEMIFEHNLLKPEGILILEHSKNYDFSGQAHYFDKRIYGSVNFSFFK
jgi:16S rRNA (guanine(966)-N(2))-methyltransferase RsmD